MQFPTPMPLWIDHAFRHRGLKEIVGPKGTNATIVKWLKSLKAWWSDDETPWCGTFVAHNLQEAGLAYPEHWYRAKGYCDYGDDVLKSIPFGAICVKGRVGGGHVFFAVAQSRDGQTIYGLGGNQGNCVSVAPFRRSDIIAARFPSVKNTRQELPVALNAADINAAKVGSEA